MQKKAKGSVRYRIALVYFMLVFIAMAIVSVYLMGSIKSYQKSSLEQNIQKTIEEGGLLTTLSKYEPLRQNANLVQQTLNENLTGGLSEELSVVGTDMQICASTNSQLIGLNAADVFDVDMIINILVYGGSDTSETNNNDFNISNYCYAIQNENGGIMGVVYVRADLSSINTFISNSRIIFIRATAIALAVTLVLGIILARSITDPINDVTNTVKKMSQGDFSSKVPVKSDDEIGQLAEMFNIMQGKLDETLEEISNEKNKLGTILEYMADGLIAIDLDGKIIQLNPAARQMLDIMPEADLTGTNYDLLLGNISDTVSLESIKNNCEDGGGNGIFEREGGIFAIRYDYFKDEEGSNVGIIVILQDITERQKLEDMQQDFVANVSHELKTPLTNIKSYTETLIDSDITDEDTLKHFLGIIDSEADRMNRLVKDLLQLSRLDHKTEIITPKETNAVILIDTAVTKVALTAQQKNQQLNRLYSKDSDIRIMVDRDRFEQVILNVLSNAIKYTADGGRIDVDVFEQEGKARIIVQDNGMGISAEALPRIFERFYRVDKARSRAMGGTGLGLAITKQIVEEHGGTIYAESQEGKGTKMVIEMPLATRKGIRNIE